MHRHAGAFASGEQTVHDGAFAIDPTVDFAVGGDGDAAHGVMRGGFDRHIVAGRIEIGILFDGLHHLRQHLMHMIRIDAGHIQPDTILRPIRILRIGDSSSGVDFSHDGTAHHITRGKIGMPRRVMFHERLAIGVAQHAAFRTCRLRQQNAGMGETGRMELHELAILKLKAGGQCQRHAVTGQIPRIRRGMEQTAGTASGHQHIACVDGMRLALVRVERHHALDLAVVFGNHQIGHIPFLGELNALGHALLP